MTLKLSRVVFLIMAIAYASTANATLLSRLGGIAAYDTVLEMTWVTNASLDVGRGGSGQWAEIVAWVDGLNYLGYDDWRLPTIDEFLHMYDANMGGSFEPGSESIVVDGVLLTGIQTGIDGYWSSTGTTLNSALLFDFEGGRVDCDCDNHGYFGQGWPVRAGDVTVAEPSLVALTGSVIVLLWLLPKRDVFKR